MTRIIQYVILLIFAIITCLVATGTAYPIMDRGEALSGIITQEDAHITNSGDGASLKAAESGRNPRQDLKANITHGEEIKNTIVKSKLDISPKISSKDGTILSQPNLMERIDAVLRHGKLPFLFFYADWCGFCKKQMPILMNLEEAYGNDIEFIWLNERDHRKDMPRFAVAGFPTMILIKRRDEERYINMRFRGYTDKDILLHKGVKSTLDSCLFFAHQPTMSPLMRKSKILVIR